MENISRFEAGQVGQLLAGSRVGDKDRGKIAADAADFTALAYSRQLLTHKHVHDPAAAD